MGYEITGRDALDGNGKPYPVLHLQLGKPGISFPCEIQLAEKHPLGFYLPANTRLLMLGSFPPKKERWSMNFYYPNIQNDMWRIIGYLFYQGKEHFLIPGKKAFDEDKAKRFCTQHGIGIGDTAEEIVRLKDNASDKFLEVIKPLDLEKVLQQIPDCRAIVITGQKAMDTLLSIVNAEEPAVGQCTEFTYMDRSLRLYRMPSSSRAYPKPIEEKATFYGKMFKELGFPLS